MTFACSLQKAEDCRWPRCGGLRPRRAPSRPKLRTNNSARRASRPSARLGAAFFYPAVIPPAPSEKRATLSRSGREWPVGSARGARSRDTHPRAGRTFRHAARRAGSIPTAACASTRSPGSSRTSRSTTCRRPAGGHRAPLVPAAIPDRPARAVPRGPRARADDLVQRARSDRGRAALVCRTATAPAGRGAVHPPRQQAQRPARSRPSAPTERQRVGGGCRRSSSCPTHRLAHPPSRGRYA